MDATDLYEPTRSDDVTETQTRPEEGVAEEATPEALFSDRRAQRIVARARAEQIARVGEAEVRLLEQRWEAERTLIAAQADAALLASNELTLAASYVERMRALEMEARALALAPPAPAGTEQAPDTEGEQVGIHSDDQERAKVARLAGRAAMVPLICGTTAALVSQLLSFGPDLEQALKVDGLSDVGGTVLAYAIATIVAVVIEGLGLAFLAMARGARLDGDSPTVFRVLAWSIASFAIYTNLRHWSPGWVSFQEPEISPVGWMFGAVSLASIGGWEALEMRRERARRAAKSRHLFGEQEPIPPRPELGFMRRIVAPWHTTAAWAVAVRERTNDVDYVLGRATEILDARAERRAKRRANRRAGFCGRMYFVVVGQVYQPKPPKPKNVKSERVEQETTAAPAPAAKEIQAPSAEGQPAAAPTPKVTPKSAPRETALEKTGPMLKAMPNLPANWDEIIAEGVRCARQEMNGSVTGAGKRDELATLIRRREDLKFGNELRGHVQQAVKRALEQEAAA
jgi:hypothetical protein